MKNSHKGVIEAQAHTKIKWWESFMDILMNPIQGQKTITDVTVRFKQINDKIYQLEFIETDSSGVGMTKQTVVDKYYHTHTLKERMKDPSTGAGKYTMGVLNFTMKMTKGLEELYSKGLEVLTRVPHETLWINHNYDMVNLKDVVTPRELIDEDAIKLGYPIEDIGTHGTYQRWPEIDTSGWGDNWFEELAQLIECYFVFAIKKKINFTLEKHDLLFEPIIRECQKLVFPCVDTPYIDQWTNDCNVKIGNTTFTMRALLRPELQELKSGSNYKKIRQKYEYQMWKHPYESFGENMVLVVVEKDALVCLDIRPNIVKGGVTMRGTVVIEVGKDKVETDINKSQVKFISSKGEPFSDKSDNGWKSPIKEKFDDFFPYSKENENDVRNQLRDVLTGKRWPSTFLPLLYEPLCKDLNITPYDYEWAKKHFMKKTLGDGILDCYNTGNRDLIEVKITLPCKDRDYNQIKSYAFDIVTKDGELSDTKRIIMFANSDGEGYDTDTEEKFTSRLNDGQDKIEFMLLDLSKYGLEKLHETYKDTPTKVIERGL